jgi:predicted RNase H-like HicB family nuclease
MAMAMTMELEEYLAVPYILRMETGFDRAGNHICRAEHPELPDCVVEARSPIDALEQLDAARTQLIRERFARGDPIPAPRPPLPELLSPRLRLRQSPRALRVVEGLR